MDNHQVVQKNYLRGTKYSGQLFFIEFVIETYCKTRTINFGKHRFPSLCTEIDMVKYTPNFQFHYFSNQYIITIILQALERAGKENGGLYILSNIKLAAKKFYNFTKRSRKNINATKMKT